MLTAAVLALLLGAFLLIAGGTAALLKAGANRERRIIERHAPTPIGAWRPGTRRIAAAGLTAYGPGGRVVAPVSGIECAWFAVQLIRTPTRRPDPRDEPGQDILLDLAAPIPPALTDGTGSVLIDPRLLAGPPNDPPNLDDPLVTETTMRMLYPGSAAPFVVPRELIEDVRSYETLCLWETRLAAGRPAYALGTTARSAGSLVLRPTSREGFTVLTGDDRQAVLERRRASAVSTRSLAIGLSCAGAVVTAASAALLFVVA